MKIRLIKCGIFIILLLSLSFISSYGLYETNSTGNTNFSVGKWQITLNDEDITVNRNATLNDFLYTTDSHTEEGYLSPGGSASLDLVIDASSVSTKLSYDIAIDKTQFDAFPNIDVTITDLDTGLAIDTEYSGIIELNDSDKTKNIRIIITWNNDSQYDESDINVIDANPSISVDMHFLQV